MSQSATLATKNDIPTCFEGLWNLRKWEVLHLPPDMLEPLNEHSGTPKSTTWKPMFRGRRSSIFSPCHKTPCLPRNLHIVATWRSTDNAIRKNHITWHVWSAAPATQNEDGGLQSAALATKHGSHALKTMRKYRACHTEWLLARYETCWNVTKRHACHAKLRYATFETSQSD